MTFRRTANLAWVCITCVCFSLACVPDPMEPDGGEQPDDSMQQPDPPPPNDPPAPPADLIAFAWPAVDSLCELDEDCATGLFCDSLDQETIDAFLATVDVGDVPEGTPLTVDENVCQFGCRIDGEFVAAGETDPDANGCRSCQPEISETDWTPMAAGTSCEDGSFCTSASGAAGDADACDGAGVCVGEAVQCDDGLFCNGDESCDEETNACVSSGDPCPATECNTCQEDTDSCFDLAGTACGSDKDTTCDNPDTCDGAGTCEPNIASPNTVCRSAAGPCDLPETCSSDGKCHPDVFRQSGFVCDAGSGDACDPDEVCSGTSAECPDDTFEPGSTVCNAGTGDVCDPDEFCPGVPDQGCPVDSFEFTSTVCRAAAGDCDEAEMCPGVADIGCPADEKKSAGFECRAIAGGCDIAEVCDGANDECPVDERKSFGTECRAVAGDCDVAEVCDGASAECPTDLKRDVSFECRASADICDVAEFCDGSNAGCPDDAFAGTNVECRRAGETLHSDGPSTFTNGDCDIAEFCTGDGADCPADELKEPDTICRPSAGLCDTEVETCSGNFKSCPDDNVYQVFTCRAAVTDCDVEEMCAGPSQPGYPNCPPDEVAPSGTPCKLTPPNPIIQACDVQDYCDGVSNICPEDVRLDEGDTCYLEVDGVDAEGTCGPTIFPVFLGLRKCIVPGDAPNGTSCLVNADCASLKCAPTLEEDVKLCIAADEVGFGQVCDGDGFHLAGDPDGRQCTETGGFMNCCANGNLPGEGETGTCRECCRDDDLTGGLAIGCDNGDSPLCCDDRCTDASYDPENCGECGTDCLAIANANVCLEFVSCGGGTTPGECQFTLPCPAPAADHYAVCTDSHVLCRQHHPFSQQYADCIAQPSVAVCEEFERQSDTLCMEGCNTNDDCELDEVCRSRCGGAPYAEVQGCIDGTYCAETAGQCD